MKFLALLAVLLLFVDLSLQVPRLLNCTEADEIPSYIKDTCGEYTCDGNGGVSGVGCPVTRCAPGTEIGFEEEDDSETYPDCCSRPICSS